MTPPARRAGSAERLEPDESSHNLAIDAATVASRVMGRDVTMVTLESRAEMPADASEIAEGSEEGVRLLNRRGPVEILGPAVGSLGCGRSEWRGCSTTRADSRPSSVRAPKRTSRATPSSSPSGRWPTSISWAPTTASHDAAELDRGRREDAGDQSGRRLRGGDIAFGPRIVISAVADGRRAARAIDTHLTGRTDAPPRHRLRVFSTFGYDHPFARGDYETRRPDEIEAIPVERRTQAAEVEKVLGEAEARAEGSRCLHCWVNTVFDSSRMNGSECIECGGCVDVCPEQCIDLVSLRRLSVDPGAGALRLPDGAPFPAPGQPGAALLKDETACIRCGLCARRCPVGLITMQAVYREDEAALCRLADSAL